MRPKQSEAVLNKARHKKSIARDFTVRPEQSEAVLNKARHKKSIARDFTVRPEQKSSAWRIARGEETRTSFALRLSNGSTGKREKNQAIVTRNKLVSPATSHSLLVPARIRAQGGFAIAAAIFLIVVLALLAVGMVQISSTSHTSLSQEYTSARAYMAARSGLQWGMYQAIYTGSGNSIITFSGGALAGTQADISSSGASVDGDTFYTIDSGGAYGVSTDAEYSLRQLRLRFSP